MVQLVAPKHLKTPTLGSFPAPRTGMGPSFCGKKTFKKGHASIFIKKDCGPKPLPHRGLRRRTILFWFFLAPYAKIPLRKRYSLTILYCVGCIGCNQQTVDVNR